MIIVFNCTAAKGQDPLGKTGGGAVKIIYLEEKE
jgi:hypothetical protein